MPSFLELAKSMENESNAFIIEAVIDGYNAIFESSPSYVASRLKEIKEMDAAINEKSFTDAFVGEHNGGYIFDYCKFYLVLFGEISRAIGEYTKFKGKPAIILYILDGYLEQWMELSSKDPSKFSNITNSLKHKINQNIVTLAHERTHMADDEAGILLDDNKKTRKPSEGRLKEVIDRLVAQHPEFDRDYIVKFVTAINSDVEFNAMLSAAIFAAIKHGRTSNFDDFKDAVLNGEQFVKNQQLLTREQYARLLKRIHQFWQTQS